jgi:hypothetical protein
MLVSFVHKHYNRVANSTVRSAITGRNQQNKTPTCTFVVPSNGTHNTSFGVKSMQWMLCYVLQFHSSVHSIQIHAFACPERRTQHHPMPTSSPESVKCKTPIIWRARISRHHRAEWFVRCVSIVVSSSSSSNRNHGTTGSTVATSFWQSLPLHPCRWRVERDRWFFAVSSCAFAHHLLVRNVWQRASALSSIAQDTARRGNAHVHGIILILAV